MSLHALFLSVLVTDCFHFVTQTQHCHSVCAVQLWLPMSQFKQVNFPRFGEGGTRYACLSYLRTKEG
jgi:hypothetical protein